MTKTFLKIIAVFLSVLLLIPIISGCNENITDADSSVTVESSTDGVTQGNSNESSVPSDDDNSSQEESIVPQDTVVSFLACPDNIIHPSVFYDALERAAKNNGVKADYSDLHNATYDFPYIYEHVADAVKNADIAYINQETLIGGTSGVIYGYPVFNSPKPVADTVIDLGFDVVNVAHNHMLDSGDTRYLENCTKLFEDKSVDVIGYYPDEASTENITVIEREGIKIAFLSYTYGTNGIPLPKNSKFVIPYFSEELVKRQVARAKQVADVIITSCHWGYEDTFGVNSEQKKYAKLMCELGVDVVLGMHPHVIQPMEWMTSESGKKTLVVYSLGNFVSGMVAGMNMLGGMLSLDIVKDVDTGAISIENPLFIPTVTHYTGKKSAVAHNDTGYRNYKIYYLSDYTQEQAATHYVCTYEVAHNKTSLVNGKFSKQTLIDTVMKYIPLEFLPEEYR